MQTDQQQFGQNAKFPLADQVGSGYVRNRSLFFGQNVDFQPSKICPRNFVIFDWTNNHSQIMYHPAAVPSVGYPNAAYIDNNMIVQNDENAHKEVVIKEDSADIDLLLSFEEEDEYEEEEVSTARTHGYDASDTADSCSSRPGNRNRNTKLGLSSSNSHKSSERKREKMKKMVNSLRGFVPGGNHMNTAAVIDEAVKYLKSLKAELQKADVGNLKKF